MNTLYLSIDGISDPLGRSQILPYLLGLSKFGHKFYLLSLEKQLRFEKEKLAIKKVVENTSIQWFPLIYIEKTGVLNKTINAKNLKNEAEEIIKKNKIEIIHARGYVPALIGLSLKNKYNLKLIFDMRGFWPDERLDGNIWKMNNPIHFFLYKYFKFQEKKMLRNANHVVSLTQKGKNILLSNFKFLRTESISVIPCFADLKHFDFNAINLERLNNLKLSLKIASSDLVFLYLGSLGTWYMTNEMCDFFKVIKDKNPNAKLLIVTKDDTTEFLNHATKIGLQKEDLIFREASRDEVPYFIECSDIALFFIKPSFSKQASSPTKMGEIMGLGKPIITNAGVGDVDDILNETQSGYIIENFTKENYELAANSIEEIKNIPKDLIRKGGLAFYDLENGILKYHTIYNSLA